MPMGHALLLAMVATASGSCQAATETGAAPAPSTEIGICTSARKAASVGSRPLAKATMNASRWKKAKPSASQE